MALIFVEEISERLTYTLDFIFKERGLSYDLTNDHHFFANSSVPKLNYSNRTFDSIPQLLPASLIFDEQINVYGINSSIFENEECLAFNEIIDPIASIFYVLSRMEEYTSSLEDIHGRFPASNSILNRFNWLDKAVCDRWAVAFLSFLSREGIVSYSNEKHHVHIVPTFDIDNTFAYKLKSGLRTSLSTIRDFLEQNNARIKERRLVLKGKMKDPYDTFDYILSIIKRGFSARIFWLVGDYSKYDKNITYKNLLHQQLIQKMAKSVTLGLHPSYKSNSYEYFLLNEKERLEAIIGQPIEHSRQHYLKMKIPVTYPSISTMGIQHDYSMGYAEACGFRAGTARPFHWFDLHKNSVSNLLVHPFVYMDGTLHEYLQLTPLEAQKIIQKLYDELQQFGGDLVCIWHNETIGNYGKWEGWNDVLEFTLRLNNTHNE